MHTFIGSRMRECDNQVPDQPKSVKIVDTVIGPLCLIKAGVLSLVELLSKLP